MFPRFGEIWGQPIPAYFTMLVAGFTVATWLGVRWAKRSGLDHDVVIDVGLMSLIAGVVGARILHVIADGYFWDYVHLCTDPAKVAWRITRVECTDVEGLWDVAAGVCRPKESDCFAWAAFWRGGLAYYGGLAVAVPYLLWFLRRERFPMGKASDMAGMVIPVGLFFGRMGCFLGGCCFGVRTDDPLLGVRFPEWSAASSQQWKQGLLGSPAEISLPVHAAQLYEAIGCLAIAAAMMFVVHPRKRFDGQVFLAFLGGYAVLRFLLEYVRADDRGGLFGLSTSQLISAGVVIAVVAVWVWLSRRAREALAKRLPSAPSA